MMTGTVARQLQSRASLVLQLVRRNIITNSASQRIVPTCKRCNSSAAAEEGGSSEGGQKLSTESPGPPPNARTIRGGPVSWLSLGLAVATGAGLLAYFDHKTKQRIEDLKHGTAVAVPGPSVGKAAIGGPFKLVNHEGKVVTDRDFVGNWTLIYFGFTFCPDICPAELTKLANAIDNIGKQIGVKVVPVFISVDPERDTVEQVREYLKDYHPRMVGLTGSVDDIRRVAREYRVYYMKTEEEGSDYLVDHSIIMYLMDPDMNFVKFFGKNYDADSLTTGVIDEIKMASKR